MKYSPGDLADRFTISRLKVLRLNSIDTAEFLLLLDERLRSGVMDFEIQSLENINGKIWDLESDLRQGKLQNPQTEAEFAEIGRRALAIRDLNRERIRIKNAINARLGEGFQEIKGNHCSEIATSPA